MQESEVSREQKTFAGSAHSRRCRLLGFSLENLACWPAGHSVDLRGRTETAWACLRSYRASLGPSKHVMLQALLFCRGCGSQSRSAIFALGCTAYCSSPPSPTHQSRDLFHPPGEIRQIALPARPACSRSGNDMIGKHVIALAPGSTPCIGYMRRT